MVRTNCKLEETHREPQLRRMIRFLSGVIFLAIVSQAASGADFYVSAKRGSNGYNGHEQTPWKTISFAAKRINSGDTVYVEAGLYDIRNDIMTTQEYWDSDGIEIEHDNVQFIGFKYGTGDQKTDPIPPKDAGEFETRDAQGHWKTEYPVVLGQDRGRAIGFKLADRSNVLIKNMHVRNFEEGIHVERGRNNTIDNALLVDFGKPTVENAYVGYGAKLLLSNGSEIKNSMLMNAEAVGFTIAGSEMKITNCRGYNTKSISPIAEKRGIDYGFLITTHNEDSTKNRITDCYYEVAWSDRDSTPKLYRGHGFTVSCGDPPWPNHSFGNVIKNCMSRNADENFLLRGPNCRNNEFIDCRSDFGMFAIKFTGGPHDNNFRRFRSNFDERAALQVTAHRDGKSPFYLTAVDVTKNTFLNCAFHISGSGVEGAILGSQSVPGEGPYAFRDNLFVNCSFATGCYTTGRRQVAHLANFHANTVSAKDLTFVNCIFRNFVKYKQKEDFEIEPTFRNCCFFSNVFDKHIPLPGNTVSTGNTTINQFPGATFIDCNTDDPGLVGPVIPFHSGSEDKFLNPAYTHRLDFHLRPDAPGAINRGLTAQQLSEYIGVARLLDIDQEGGPYDESRSGLQKRYDIGADEFRPSQGNPAPSSSRSMASADSLCETDSDAPTVRSDSASVPTNNQSSARDIDTHSANFSNPADPHPNGLSRGADGSEMPANSSTRDVSSNTKAKSGVKLKIRFEIELSRSPE